MSYIPPHSRRLPQDNQPNPAAPAVSEQTKTMPYIPPHLRRSPQPTPASSSTRLHPHLPIRSSSDVIYRFFVLLHHPHMGCQHVTFTSSENAHYPHLEDFQLYTLSPDLDHSGQQQNSTEIVEQERIRRDTTDVIFKAWKEDLKEVLEKFGRITQAESPDMVLPVILLRFGRNMFHDRRGFFHWGTSHTPKNLESDVEAKRLSKTFDSCLSRKEFVFLRKLACKDALLIQPEHICTIEVKDAMNPGSDLLCTCLVHFGANKDNVNLGKTDDLSGNTSPQEATLELTKVMFLPVRHMIGDVACVGKIYDIRLALLVEEYPSLTETELCDLKSCFNDVILMDDKTWELPKHSTSGRFEVVKSVQATSRVVTSGGLKWYFYVGNSFQVHVKPIICEEFCQGRKEWNTEEALLCIDELLQSVWANCII